jgi:hypothetical protein
MTLARYTAPTRHVVSSRTIRCFTLLGILVVAHPAAAQLDSPSPDTILNLVRQGQRTSAAELWDNIDSSSQRIRVANQMAGALAGENDFGGGALADFDTLINLITSTIEPESWEANGGTGTLQGFPSGVYVDAQGCLRRIAKSTSAELRSSLRRALTEVPLTAAPSPDRSLRKISLPRLERSWLRKVLAGDPIPSEMYRLAGLQRVEYVAVNQQTGDVILAGPATDTGPSLSLDAWLHVFQNALIGEQRFGCSIEPRADRIAAAQKFIQRSAGAPISPAQRGSWSRQLRDHLGRQQIVVHGLDPRSHAARIIVTADYHMKLIGMGIESGAPHVDSYLSMIEPGPDGRPPAMDVLRWWFTLDYDRLEADVDRKVFRLVGNAARVMCENEFLNEQGRRVHTGTAEPNNQEFAAQFSRHINDLADRFPIYRQLQGLFDLSVAAALIREEGLPELVGWEPLVLRLSPVPTPPGTRVATDVETVVKVRELNQRIFVTGVSGGVDVDPRTVLKNTVAVPYQLQDARQAISPDDTYEVDPRWWWD